MKWFNNLLLKMEKKHNEKYKGIMLFYITYEPDKAEPNVFSHHLDPELRNVPELDHYLGQAADLIRGFYRENPERVDVYMEQAKLARSE